MGPGSGRDGATPSGFPPTPSGRKGGHGGARDRPRLPSQGRSCSLRTERRRVERLHSVEDEARHEGFAVVAGVDEVGRGCLAGPVYAGAVVLDPAVRILGLDDSKRLLAEVREGLTPAIRAKALGVGIGAATPAEIDALGIVEATLLAMRRALLALVAQGTRPDLVLFDAVRLPGLAVPQRAYIRGDARVAAIAAASIVAKTERDHVMVGLHEEYPYYGFASHRGYGTPEHLAALHRHGPSPVHRLSFDGVIGGAGDVRSVTNPHEQPAPFCQNRGVSARGQ